jgi:hypothetical protein
VHELYEDVSHLYERIAEDFESGVKNKTSAPAKFLGRGTSMARCASRLTDRRELSRE